MFDTSCMSCIVSCLPIMPEALSQPRRHCCYFMSLGACISNSGTNFKYFSWLHDVLHACAHIVILLAQFIQFCPNGIDWCKLHTIVPYTLIKCPIASMQIYFLKIFTCGRWEIGLIKYHPSKPIKAPIYVFKPPH